MGKTRVLTRQLRLPFISYYVTVVDTVNGSTVSVVDGQTWREMVRQHRERILRIEHKSFEYGLVANLVLKNVNNQDADNVNTFSRTIKIENLISTSDSYRNGGK